MSSVFTPTMKGWENLNQLMSPSWALVIRFQLLHQKHYHVPYRSHLSLHLMSVAMDWEICNMKLMDFICVPFENRNSKLTNMRLHLLRITNIIPRSSALATRTSQIPTARASSAPFNDKRNLPKPNVATNTNRLPETTSNNFHCSKTASYFRTSAVKHAVQHRRRVSVAMLHQKPSSHVPPSTPLTSSSLLGMEGSVIKAILPEAFMGSWNTYNNASHGSWKPSHSMAVALQCKLSVQSHERDDEECHEAIDGDVSSRDAIRGSIRYRRKPARDPPTNR